MEPDSQMDELQRVCDVLMQYLNKEEGKELVHFVIVREKPGRLYDELDNQAASIAISELSSLD